METDKQYDYFVGTTLRKDSNDIPLEPGVTLLDNNGSELCSFNGYFEALVENVVVIQNYFNAEEQMQGDSNTYLYDYITGQKSEIHDDAQIFKYGCESDEETAYLIGLDCYHDNNGLFKWLYTFYDKNLNVVAKASEDEIEDWYIKNDDWESFDDAGEDYDAYFTFAYQNVDTEKNK